MSVMKKISMLCENEDKEGLINYLNMVDLTSLTGKSSETIANDFTKIAKDLLVGKKIKKVLYLSNFDAEQMLWDRRSVMIIFDDGSSIIPMSDDEGNEAGSIACMGDNVEVETIPVMRERF